MDKEGEQIRRVLMSQRGPGPLLAAYQLASDHQDPSVLRNATLGFTAEYLSSAGSRREERERFLDSGLLDAITHVQAGGRLTEDQKQVLEQRWKNHGTPLGGQINKMYEASDLRWDREWTKRVTRSASWSGLARKARILMAA